MTFRIRQAVGEAIFAHGLFIVISIIPSSLLLEPMNPNWFPGGLVAIMLGLLLTSMSRFAVLYRSFDAMNREAFLLEKVAPILSTTRRVVMLKNPETSPMVHISPMSAFGMVCGMLTIFFEKYFIDEPSWLKVLLIVFLTCKLFHHSYSHMHRTRIFDQAKHKNARSKLISELGTRPTLAPRYIPRWPRLIIELRTKNSDWFNAACTCAYRSDIIVFDVTYLRSGTALERELKYFTHSNSDKKKRFICLIWKEYREDSAEVLRNLGFNTDTVIPDSEVDKIYNLL